MNILYDLSHKKWSNLRTFCRVYEMSKCARLQTAHFTRKIQRFYRDFTNFCDIYKWFNFSCVYLTYGALHQLKHLKEFITFVVVFFFQWYPRNSYYASIQVSLLRHNSKFSAEVIDALMLAVKENAHECKLDLFVKVRYMLHNRGNIYLQTCCCFKK